MFINYKRKMYFNAYFLLCFALKTYFQPRSFVHVPALQVRTALDLVPVASALDTSSVALQIRTSCVRTIQNKKLLLSLMGL